MAPFHKVELDHIIYSACLGQEGLKDEGSKDVRYFDGSVSSRTDRRPLKGWSALDSFQTSVLDRIIVRVKNLADSDVICKINHPRLQNV